MPCHFNIVGPHVLDLASAAISADTERRVVLGWHSSILGSARRWRDSISFKGIANDWNSRAGADRVWIIRDASVARVLCELFVFANRLYTRAGYHGPTNVGYSSVSPKGQSSASWFEGIRARPPMGAPPLPSDVRRIDQVLVAELASDRVKDNRSDPCRTTFSRSGLARTASTGLITCLLDRSSRSRF